MAGKWITIVANVVNPVGANRYFSTSIYLESCIISDASLFVNLLVWPKIDIKKSKEPNQKQSKDVHC